MIPFKSCLNWRAVAVAALILLGVSACLFSDGLSESGARGSIVIGLPEGIGGLIPRAMIDNSSDQLRYLSVDAMSFKDCCSSNMSWALSGEEMSMAVLCPEAAHQLLRKDKRYVEIGPVAANSDVLVVRPEADVNTIGIMHNRPNQEEIARAYYGSQCRIVPMLPGALPYAYERKAVDAVVVDALQAFSLNGSILPGTVQGNPVISYVLVVKNELIGTPDYETFMGKWSELAGIFNQPGQFEELILPEIPGAVSREKEVNKWIQLNVIFMDPVKKNPAVIQ